MRIALYFLLALSPLPFASVRPVWQWSWILFIALCALAVAMKLTRNGRKRPALTGLPGAAMLCVVLFAAWGLFQALVPLFAGHLVLLPDLATLSIYPEQTIKVSLFFLAHTALFLLVFLYVRGRSGRSAALVKLIAAVGALYALYGFVVYLSGSNHVLWFEKTAYKNVVTSTFINRNSYAAYAGLGLAAMNVILFLKVDTLRRGMATPRDYLLTVFAGHGWYQALAYLILLSALLLTGSRAGILSVFAAQAIMVLLFFRSRGGRGNLPVVLALGAIILLALALSGGILLDRTLDNNEANERFIVYDYVWDAIRERPLSGYGIGTFNEAFRLYRGENVRLYFDRAHNDYLEIAMTAGIPAALVLIAAPLLLMISYLKAVTRAIDMEKCAFSAMGIAILVQLGLHSLLDFSLQIPAVSLLFVVLLALVSAKLAGPDKTGETR